MSATTEHPKKTSNKRNWTSPATLLKIGAVAVVVLGAVWFFQGGSEAYVPGTTFAVERGPLEITVLEGGEIQSLESQEIRSEVRGREGTKILKIVEEGYYVTPEDVENGKILVELDASNLIDQLTNQEIQFQSTESDYIEERQDYEIQVNQNESNIKSAELAVKFARMDFEKYMGAAPVQEILDRLDLNYEPGQFELTEEAMAAATEPLPGEAPTERQLTVEDIVVDEELMQGIREKMMAAFEQGGANVGGGGGWTGGRQGGEGRGPRSGGDGEEGRSGRGGGMRLNAQMIDRMKQMGVDVFAVAQELGKVKEPEPVLTAEGEGMAVEMESTYTKPSEQIDFSEYVSEEILGDGEAKQQLRQLQDDLLVAREELSLARTQLDGTKRLAEKNFVTQNDLDADKMRVQKAEIKQSATETALELFTKYTFPKQAEQLLSDYEEALRSLERARIQAFGDLSKAKARLSSDRARFLMEQQRLNDLRRQIDACIIRAEQPGMVVYGSSAERSFRGNNEPIQEGTTVRERQLIITIPNRDKMAVEVQVHESSVERVTKGQAARIIVDARPNEVLEGTVTYVSPLPNSQDRWMNPDMKVYNTTVEIDTAPEWLRPGMSAEVTILVTEIPDTLYLPIQAVRAEGNERVCYVVTPNGPERRVIETGVYSNEFIQIIDGVSEGEQVYLRPPAKERNPEPGEAEEGQVA